MRAWQVSGHGEPEVALQLVELHPPVPPTAGVVLDVEAAGLNFPDVLLCRGAYHERPPLPFVPGFEVCGRILETGPRSRWEPGQRVVAATTPPAGGLAETVAVPDAGIYPVADGVPAATAAGMFITYQTAYLALHRRARLVPAETVLVHGGAGGVGSAAIQVAKAAGARVLATARGSEKVARCSEIGADDVIDYRAEDFVRRVRELTDGRGVDVVFDPVGGDVFDGSRRVIASEGRLLVIGFAGGRIPEVPAGHVLVKNYAVVGMHWALYQRADPARVREAHEALQTMLTQGAISPAISGVVGFDDIPEALGRLAGRQAWGKLVARVGKDKR